MFSAVAILVVLVLNALMGITVFIRNSRSPVNVFFGAFVLFIDLWILSNFFENEPLIVGVSHAELFLRLDFAIAPFLFWAWFRFCEAFSGVVADSLKGWRGDSVLLSAATLLALMSLFSDLILHTVYFADDIIQFSAGPMWITYALIVASLFLGGFLLLGIGARQAVKMRNRQKQMQLSLVFIGTALSVGNAILINLVLQPFTDIGLELSRIGIYGLVLLVGFTAYAIIRYRFFDLKLLIVRSVAFVIIVALVVLLYILVSYTFIAQVVGVLKDPVYFWLDILIGLLVAVSFRPLYQLVSIATSRFLYKRYYDIEEILSRISAIMISSLDTDIIVPRMLDVVLDALGSKHASIIISERGTILESATYPERGVTLISTPSDFKVLSESYAGSGATEDGQQRVVLVDDVGDEFLAQELRAREIAVVLPLIIKGELAGFIVLGERLSGERYSQHDVDFLNRLSLEASIGIQNVRSYEIIKEFSASLEQKVEDRTKELKAAQKRELEKARDVARLKDEFVFIATHELRAPITAIRIYLELIREKEAVASQEAKDHLEGIEYASQNLNQLIDDLLEIARSESGTLKIAVQPIRLNDLLFDLTKQVAEFANKKNVQILMNIDEHCPMLMGDPDKLREVITNLLTNAIKYNREGGIVEVNAVPVRDQVIVEFRDTGYGIPEEQKEQVFEKFFRVSREETAEVSGTGLGLFITRMLIQKMGGNIEFNSTDTHGTTFAFALPRAVA
jgi:signal transduction histidine kinase